MTEFITGVKLTETIKAVLAGGAQAHLAVAFWGTGSIRLLGLPGKLSHVQIICDLRSGSCNPTEIATLRDRGAEIRTLDGLHAKVYLSEGMAVVGSANASANGLAEEGGEIDYELEAAVFSSDESVTRNAKTWFETCFRRATKVTPQMIEDARPNWARRSRTRPARLTLLQMLEGDPRNFENRAIRAVAYENLDPTHAEEEVYKQMGPTVFQGAYSSYLNKKVWPFYIDRKGTLKVSPGEWFLDFAVAGKPGQLKVAPPTVWQVVDDEKKYQHAVSKRSKARLIFMDGKGSIVNGVLLPKTEGKKLAKLVQAYLNTKVIKPDVNGNLLDVELRKLPALLGMEGPK